MSIEIPAELGWLFSRVVGDNWPRGDEDLLRKCADAWRRAAREVRDEEEAAWQLTRRVAATMEGPAADASRAAIDGLVSADEQSLRELAATCDRMAETCERYATAVEQAKLAIVEQVASLDTSATAALSSTTATTDISLSSLAALADQLAVTRERVRTTFEGLVGQAGEMESNLDRVGEFEGVRVVTHDAAASGGGGYALSVAAGEPLEGLAPVPGPAEGAGDPDERPGDAGDDVADQEQLLGTGDSAAKDTAKDAEEERFPETPGVVTAASSEVLGGGDGAPGAAPTSPARAVEAPAPGTVSAALQSGGHGGPGGAGPAAHPGGAGAPAVITGGGTPAASTPSPGASRGGTTPTGSGGSTSPAGGGRGSAPPGGTAGVARVPGSGVASPPSGLLPPGGPPGSGAGSPGISAPPGGPTATPGPSGGVPGPSGGEPGGGVARFGDPGSPSPPGRTLPAPDRSPVLPAGDSGSRPRDGRPPVWLATGAPHRPEYTDGRRRDRTTTPRTPESSRWEQEYGRADFFRAGRKRVEELTDGEVAAFLQLHGEVVIGERTVMQKVVTPWHAECCLDNTIHRIGGLAARWEDLALCRDPAELQEAFGLGYREPDGKRPFDPNDPVIHLVRFPALDPEAYKRPFGGRDPEHAELYREMWGLPSVRDVEIWSYPFTGTGFTGSQRRIVPVFLLKEDLPVPSGAELYELTAEGGEELLAVYVAVRGWVAVLDAGPPAEA